MFASEQRACNEVALQRTKRSAGLCKVPAPECLFGLGFVAVLLGIIPAPNKERSGTGSPWSGSADRAQCCFCSRCKDLPGHRLSIAYICVGDPLLTCMCCLTERMNVVVGESMNSYSHILFNKSPEQLRHLGARGGRAYGRNQRARRALVATSPQTIPPLARSPIPIADSIALLDTRFPWLRGAEKRLS